ncbi:MAG: hypothetical protein ACLVDB_01235 [Anaeromassilibacillus sp.]
MNRSHDFGGPGGRRLLQLHRRKPEARANAVAYLERFLPAHLNVILDFRDLSWNTIDHAEKTFDEWDAGNSTWDQLDQAEDELFER